MTVFVEEGHLGGYIVGGDPATYFPDLWTWLVEGPLQVKRILDVGCGEGHSLKFFRELGCDVVGLEGIPQDDPDIYEFDFTAPGVLPKDALKEDFDLVWCCEFVEHVDEDKAAAFVPIFRLGKIVLMTHAFPGQLGTHHVNCRDTEYWKGFMTAAGFEFSPGMTTKTREVAAKNTDQYNHYLRSGLAFRRHDSFWLPKAHK